MDRRLVAEVLGAALVLVLLELRAAIARRRPWADRRRTPEADLQARLPVDGEEV